MLFALLLIATPALAQQYEYEFTITPALEYLDGTPMLPEQIARYVFGCPPAIPLEAIAPNMLVFRRLLPAGVHTCTVQVRARHPAATAYELSDPGTVTFTAPTPPPPANVNTKPEAPGLAIRQL